MEYGKDWIFSGDLARNKNSKKITVYRQQLLPKTRYALSQRLYECNTLDQANLLAIDWLKTNKNSPKNTEIVFYDKETGEHHVFNKE